ncbi:integrase, catalytic region, zinc finger, CCHC-type containing protein, partial [Tanacetum coccineum]
AAGYRGAQNRVRNANLGQARHIKCYNCNSIRDIARNCAQPKRPQNSEYFKDKMLLMQAQENGVSLDEEQLLFIACGQDDAIDEDVDEQPTMFMTNLSSADLVYNEASPSYDSDILSEVPDHDNYQDVVCEHHEVQEMHDEYVKDNAVSVVQSNVSSVPNDAYMMIINEMHEQTAQSVSANTQNKVVNASLTAELATYKEQIKLYERWAKFELTEREQKIKEQLRIVITDRNIKEENLKNELHFVKMQLNSTINHNKSMVEEVTSLKNDFKQKENKYLKEFLDMKALKEKDVLKMKAEALKERTPSSRPIKALTMYPPNTPATLVLRAITKEMKEIFEELEAEVEQNVVNRKYDEIERKNLLIANDNLIADCLSKEVFHIATNSKLTVSRFTKMHDAHTVVQARCLELEAKLSKLHAKVQKDDHTELVKHFSNLEVNHLNLQLKYQNLKESFGNNTSPPARDAPDFDSVFVIEKMKASIQEKDNAIKKLRMQISQLKETRKQNELFRAENEKVKQHYKELYNSIKIMRAKHIEQTTALLTENANLKVQINDKMKCITIDSVKPKVLAPGMYVVDVEPIPPRCRNNREVHLDYLKHLKESVETLHEIVKEARLETPLDRSLASACLYTKQSQELINACTDANGSQSRSNTKKNRISPANSDNKKQAEDHHRTNKTSRKKSNRVNSSISSKRAVTNLNSRFVCTTCNKCFIYANHDMCVVNYLTSVNASPSVKNVVSKIKKAWQPKQIKQVKQVWKATGKLLTNVGYQWKPTGRKFTLGEQCLLTRLTKSKVVPVQKTKNVVQIVIWYLDSGCSKHMTGDRSRLRNFVKKFIGTVRFRNDHFGAIMGYGDYVIGDSVISKEAFIVDKFHQKSVLRTPQQNGIVERRNRTLVEAARTMLIFSKALIFLCAEAVATACYT